MEGGRGGGSPTHPRVGMQVPWAAGQPASTGATQADAACQSLAGQAESASQRSRAGRQTVWSTICDSPKANYLVVCNLGYSFLLEKSRNSILNYGLLNYGLLN